jgi:hypothetical protein
MIQSIIQYQDSEKSVSYHKLEKETVTDSQMCSILLDIKINLMLLICKN